MSKPINDQMRDDDFERLLDARARLERFRELRAEAEEWPDIPVLKPIMVRPVQLTRESGVCPKCPELGRIDLRRHVCPARE